MLRLHNEIKLMILHVVKLNTFKRKYTKNKRIGLYLIE